MFAQRCVSLNTRGISTSQLELIIKHRNTHFSLYIYSSLFYKDLFI